MDRMDARLRPEALKPDPLTGLPGKDKGVPGPRKVSSHNNNRRYFRAGRSADLYSLYHFRSQKNHYDV